MNEDMNEDADQHPTNLNRQHQTDFRPSHGNSLQACVASIHALPLLSVPNFIQDPHQYIESIHRWTGKHPRLGSFHKLTITTDERLSHHVRPGARVIIRGTSPRGDFGHVVVAVVRDDGFTFDMCHDPHPESTFLQPPLVWCGVFVEPRDHVVVIGGGACGLACVRQLRRTRPFTFITLVEGRERLGGRCFSVRTHGPAESAESKESKESKGGGAEQECGSDESSLSGGWFDAGAAWAHGDSVDSPVAELAREMGVKLHPVAPRNPWLFPHALPRGMMALYSNHTRVDNVHTQEMDIGWSKYKDLLCAISDPSSTYSLGTISLRERVARELSNLEKTGEEEMSSFSLLPSRVVKFAVGLIELWNGCSSNELRGTEFDGWYMPSSSGGGEKGEGEGEEEEEEDGESDGDGDGDGDGERDVLSASYPLNGDHPGSHCSITGGMGNLMLQFAEIVVDKSFVSFPMDVKLGMTVRSVVTDEKSDGLTVVTCSNGTCLPLAQCVVCTAPLGVLQSKNKGKSCFIHFKPSLSTFCRDALERMFMCDYIKIVMTFKQKFWPKDAFFLASLDQQERMDDTTTTTTTTTTPLLFDVVSNIKNDVSFDRVLCCTVVNARHGCSNEESAMMDRIIGTLRDMFPTADLTMAKNPLIFEWSSDNFSCGAYSYAGADAMDGDFHVMGAPQMEEGRFLVLAGEHTCEEHNGSVHAALAEGRRAAKEVVEYLAKKC